MFFSFFYVFFFHGLFTTYLLYEEVMSVRLYVDPVFDGVRRRTYQYVHQRIRKHDGVLFKNFKLRYCILVKQYKEASELKSIYRFIFFTILHQI